MESYDALYKLLKEKPCEVAALMSQIPSTLRLQRGPIATLWYNRNGEILKVGEGNPAPNLPGQVGGICMGFDSKGIRPDDYENIIQPYYVLQGRSTSNEVLSLALKTIEKFRQALGGRRPFRGLVAKTSSK